MTAGAMPAVLFYPVVVCWIPNNPPRKRAKREVKFMVLDAKPPSNSKPSIRLRLIAYGRIFWGIAFLWVFGLGMRRGAWAMVAVPLLGMAATLIWAESVKRQYPTLAPKLLLAATCFLGAFATYLSAPRLYVTFVEMFRGAELSFQLHHEPALVPLQQALTDYVGQTGDADGGAILQELNRLKAKHDAGTFTADDQKEEDALFKRAQSLAARDARLQNAIEQIADTGTARTQSTSAAAPVVAPTAQTEPDAGRSRSENSGKPSANPVNIEAGRITTAPTPKPVPLEWFKPISGDEGQFIVRISAARYIAAGKVGFQLYVQPIGGAESESLYLGDSQGEDNEGSFNVWLSGVTGNYIHCKGTTSYPCKLFPGMPTYIEVEADRPSGVNTLAFALRIAPGDGATWITYDFAQIPVSVD